VQCVHGIAVGELYHGIAVGQLYHGMALLARYQPTSTCLKGEAAIKTTCYSAASSKHLLLAGSLDTQRNAANACRCNKAQHAQV
jgi:hypothetical protein